MGFARRFTGWIWAFASVNIGQQIVVLILNRPSISILVISSPSCVHVAEFSIRPV